MLRNYYSAIPEGEKFILYPLHFHPESSTSILAGTYLNEFEVIQNIAFNLPQGVKLYVKDHVSAYGYPEFELYKKLKKLPNVRVLSPHAPTKNLIKASLAVITLTSTVGYEALLLGKRVFVFGNVFYRFHKNVVQIANPSDLFNLFIKYLDNPPEIERHYNMQFVAAYYYSTEPGSLNLMLNCDAALDVVEKIYPELRRRLQTGEYTLSNSFDH